MTCEGSNPGKCEFINPGNNVFGIACKRPEALKQVSEGIEGVMLPKELFNELCLNPNEKAREQCHAYSDISEHGAVSYWCK